MRLPFFVLWLAPTDLRFVRIGDAAHPSKLSSRSAAEGSACWTVRQSHVSGHCSKCRSREARTAQHPRPMTLQGCASTHADPSAAAAG